MTISIPKRKKRTFQQNEFGCFDLGNACDVLDWIKSEEERLHWSGNTFSKGLMMNLFKIHHNRSDVYAFAYSKCLIGLKAYGELVVKIKKQACLCRIIIKPELRNQGIGKYFCDEILRFDRDKTDFLSICLNTFENNLAARKCYEFLDFRFFKSRADRRRFDSSILSVTVMKKILPHGKKR